MPKILLVNNYHYRRGGAEVVFLEQARMLREIGWDVIELSMRHPLNEPSGFEQYFPEEIEFGNDYSTLTKLRHATKIIYSFEAARAVTEIIAREKPDLVHAHNIYHHLSPSVLHAARRSGVPVFLTSHDLKLLCPAIGMLSSGKICEDCREHGRFSVVKKRCMKGSLALSSLVYLESGIHSLTGIYRNSIDQLIVPSRFFVEKFAEWGWSGAPLNHVPNFADVRALAPEFKPGAYFLYFGRLSVDKGLVTLISAAAKAGVEVRLVGGGPLESELREHAVAVGARVQFCGFRKGEELWSLVRHSRAVVLASECYENAPLSVLEGFACGKPALGARIGGIPEMIKVGETGALFESGNSDDLARTLRMYADMPDRVVEEQGRAARALVESEFTVERHIDRLLDVYRRAGIAVGR